MDMSVEGGGKGGFVGGATVLNYNRRRLQDVSCLESNEERSYSCVLVSLPPMTSLINTPRDTV